MLTSVGIVLIHLGFILANVGLILTHVGLVLIRVDLCQTFLVSDLRWTCIDLCWCSYIRADLVGLEGHCLVLTLLASNNI